MLRIIINVIRSSLVVNGFYKIIITTIKTFLEIIFYPKKSSEIGPNI